jgi:hypothetical protein
MGLCRLLPRLGEGTPGNQQAIASEVCLQHSIRTHMCLQRLTTACTIKLPAPLGRRPCKCGALWHEGAESALGRMWGFCLV